VNRDGELVEGPFAPTSELDLHLGIYARHGAGAVVHTHAPMATALSCVLDELPCVHYSMLLLGGTVPVAPYETFGTPELADAVVESLVGHTAALMANHGAVTFAEDVESAVERMSLLEWACTVYWRARSLGEPRVLDAEARAAVVSAAIERGYGETKLVDEES
jgi:L-fuculose-phosphate aldolase